MPEEWAAVADLDPERGDPPPDDLITPDGYSYPLRAIRGGWRDLLVRIASWLIEQGHISAVDCPIALPSARNRYILHTVAVHSDGSQFSNPIPVSGLWVEAQQDTPALGKRSKRLIEVARGPSAERFSVVFNADA